MKKESTFKNILQVISSNVISLLSSIFNGFIIPVILGTLNYGHYKIFVLYASYTALFHFGFNDGILLSYGGRHYSELNRYEFRSNSIFFLIFQLLLSIMIVSLCVFASNDFYKTLFILLGINCFTQNILGYYQNISQTVMRFGEYSAVTIIQYLALIVSVLSILVYCKLYDLKNISFVPYVIIIISINMALILWYIYDYRNITFGPHISLLKRLHAFKSYFISGSFMTLGFAVSVLIFNLDSQFVIKFFSTKTYGIYAFAYSMFSAGLTILGSTAVVLLPHLKRHSTKYIMNRYHNNVSYVILLVYLAIVGYFPLKLIIYKFIFEYYKSLIYFRLLLPGMVITCCVSMVISNYYYAIRKEKFYFYLSLIVLAISFLIDTLAYFIFKNPTALAFSSTLSLLIWYIFSDHFISKWYHLPWIKNVIYIILMMSLFLIISAEGNIVIGFIEYLSIYLILSISMFKKEICSFIYNLKKII